MPGFDRGARERSGEGLNLWCRRDCPRNGDMLAIDAFLGLRIQVSFILWDNFNKCKIIATLICCAVRPNIIVMQINMLDVSFFVSEFEWVNYRWKQYSHKLQITCTDQ